MVLYLAFFDVDVVYVGCFFKFGVVGVFRSGQWTVDSGQGRIISFGNFQID